MVRPIGPMKLALGALALGASLFLLAARSVSAFEGVVEKKVFSLPSFTTDGGATIKNLRVGYETYGTLDAAGDNAILICHFFSGNSHAAGRYSKDETARGYWDAVIGAGKAIDTDRYFVVSVDTLANLNTKDGRTVTTGPASIDPDTGKPYGMRFPVVTIRDFVNVQKALADALGIRRFVAVAGASMGAMQAVEWGADYPGMVDRIIPVIGVGLEADPYLVATMQLWAAPIRLDPHWNGGDYYGRAEPLEGLAAAMELVTVGARSPGWAGRGFGRKWAEAGKNPAQAFDNRYAIEAFVDKAARERARQYDANSFLYLTKAVQLFSVADRLKRVKSRILFITSRSDLLALPEYTRKTIEPLTAQQVPVEYYEIDEDGGHVDGLLHIDTMSETIRAFLDQTP